MIVNYNDIKLDIPDYKNFQIVSVRDEGKILCLEIVDQLLSDIYCFTQIFYGSGGYWVTKEFRGNKEVYIRVNGDILDILTHFYSKICEGIHGGEVINLGKKRIFYDK
jgi:hypothetical protein